MSIKKSPTLSFSKSFTKLQNYFPFDNEIGSIIHCNFEEFHPCYLAEVLIKLKTPKSESIPSE